MKQGYDAKKYFPGLGSSVFIKEDEVAFHVISKEDYDALLKRIEDLEKAAQV